MASPARKTYKARGDSGSAPTSADQGRFICPRVMTPSGCGGKTLGPPITLRSRPLLSERGVANQLGIEPEAGLPPEQAVVGVDRLPFGTQSGRLPICR